MPRNTRNEEHIRPYQPSNDAERNQKAWGLTIHEQRVGTSGNLERRTMKGSSWENFCESAFSLALRPKDPGPSGCSLVDRALIHRS